jgi:hypothetical protein
MQETPQLIAERDYFRDLFEKARDVEISLRQEIRVLKSENEALRLKVDSFSSKKTELDSINKKETSARFDRKKTLRSLPKLTIPFVKNHDRIYF